MSLLYRGLIWSVFLALLPLQTALLHSCGKREIIWNIGISLVCNSPEKLNRKWGMGEDLPEYSN